jgi:hypothetical protein
LATWWRKSTSFIRTRTDFQPASRPSTPLLPAVTVCNIDFNMPVTALSLQMLAVRWQWPSPSSKAGNWQPAPKPSSPEGDECRTCGLSKPRISIQFGRNQLWRRNSLRCRDCCIDSLRVGGGGGGGLHARRGTEYLSEAHYGRIDLPPIWKGKPWQTCSRTPRKLHGSSLKRLAVNYYHIWTSFLK